MTSVTKNSDQTEQPVSPVPDLDSAVQPQEQFAQLQKKSMRGMAITLPAQGVRAVVYLASIMILSRMLPPADFGIMSMVLVVTGFLDLFKDLGLSTAIVQREKLPRDLVGSLFLIVLAISGLLAGLVLLSGPMLSWFYREPRIVELTPLLGLAVLAGGIGMIPQALSRRHLYFGRLAVIDVLSPAIGLVVAVIAVQQGYGVRSLALQSLVSISIASALYWSVTPLWPGYPRWSAGTRDALFFGGNLSGFAFVNYFARNLDNLLIGRYWGGIELGIYSRAYAILLAPLQLINAPLTAVFVPVLSRSQNCPDDFRRHYLRGVNICTSLTFPLSATLLICSHEITQVMLGSSWGEVADVIRLLAISAPAQFINNTSGWIFVSLGRTNQLFRLGAMVALLQVLSFLVGLPFGIKGVALSYSLVVFLVTAICMWIATRDTSITLSDILRASRSGVVNAAFLSVLLVLFSSLIDLGSSELASALTLLSVGAVGMIGSALLCVLRLRRLRCKDSPVESQDSPSGTPLLMTESDLL